MIHDKWQYMVRYLFINKVSSTLIVKSTVELKTYLDESIPIIGKISVLVKY